jgi:hypothetical protein
MKVKGQTPARGILRWGRICSRTASSKTGALHPPEAGGPSTFLGTRMKGEKTCPKIDGYASAGLESCPIDFGTALYTNSARLEMGCTAAV